MKTNVTNVKVNNIRPKYKNLKDWCKDSNNVYVGRKGVVFVDGKRFPLESSIWANPFKITKEVNRKESIVLFEKYIRNKIINENLTEELKKLKGKTLGCWCKPEECHADVLVLLIDEMCKN